MYGATDEEIARVCDVHVRTVYNWKEADPQFFEDLKYAKRVADSRVERSLYERATGYSHTDTKFATFQGEITDQKTYTKHYPPDTVACIFWLKNRQPELWRDKRDVEHSGEVKAKTPVLQIVDYRTDDESETGDEPQGTIVN